MEGNKISAAFDHFNIAVILDHHNAEFGTVSILFAIKDCSYHSRTK